MKDQGMPLGDFRFCLRYKLCSQELRIYLTVLNAATGARGRTEDDKPTPKETETHYEEKPPGLITGRLKVVLQQALLACR